jgi:hypothetical protein
MADAIFNGVDAVANPQSYWNVIRKTSARSTPLLKILGTSGKKKGKNASNGHKWYYMNSARTGADNAHAEGSRRADITTFADVELANQFQIFKKTSGITGTQNESMNVEDKKEDILRQQTQNEAQIRLDIEKSLITPDAPVSATVLSDVRKSAGMKHYIPAAAKANLANAALNPKSHIDEALGYMDDYGITDNPLILMCGRNVFTDLNWMYDNQKLLAKNERSIVAVKNKIVTGWADDVTIMSNRNFADNEIIIFAPALCDIVLLRQKKNASCSDPEYDYDATESLFELTYQHLDPMAAYHIENVGRTT